MPNPFLDFVGVWCERAHAGLGPAVFFETKSTLEPRLRFNQDGGITTTQVESLRHWMNSGAVSFVLWEIVNDAVFLLPTWFISAKVTANQRGQGFKYIAREEVAECFKVEPGQGYIYWDFVRNMRSLWQP